MMDSFMRFIELAHVRVTFQNITLYPDKYDLLIQGRINSKLKKE